MVTQKKLEIFEVQKRGAQIAYVLIAAPGLTVELDNDSKSPINF